MVEKWILHRFNETAKIANEALQSREFQRATNAIYMYWLYQLCDIYIVSAKLKVTYMQENSKPLMREGTPEQKKSAQGIYLYKVISL